VSSFVDGPVRVDVPATSANLGPGFDALGLALELRDELTAEVLESGLEIEIQGAGAGALAADDSHLVVRAMHATFDVLGGRPGGLRLVCRNAIPQGRGLGSSAAAIVAGVHLARALVTGGGTAIDGQAAFRLAADLEGHPDNVAAACFGGLTVSWRDGDGFAATRAEVAASIRAVVLVPPTALSTSVARGLLPDVVPHRDAAANAGRAALLMAALSGRPSLLLAATEDLLHQAYRRPAMPDSLALVDSLRAAGHAAVVSGAGPTVLVLTLADTSDVLPLVPEGWDARVLDIAAEGVVRR
jgi:homoserine kinase